MGEAPVGNDWLHAIKYDGYRMHARLDRGFSDHVVGNGPRFHHEACRLGVEGVNSKRIDRPYVPGNRGLWLKLKCLNREELIVVGWTEPAGS